MIDGVWIGIAAGLGVRSSYNPGSTTASIVSGVLDAFSAGILIYTGLVEVRFSFFPTLFTSWFLTCSSYSYSHMNFCSINRWLKGRMGSWLMRLGVCWRGVLWWRFWGNGLEFLLVRFLFFEGRSYVYFFSISAYPDCCLSVCLFLVLRHSYIHT